MTLFFMPMDPSNRQLECVRAGYDPAIVYDPSQGSFAGLKGKGSALGVAERWPLVTITAYRETTLSSSSNM